MLCGCIGSIIASRAHNMNTVIAGYCVQGICFGAQPLLHAVVSEVLPRKHRPLAQGSVNAIAGIGGVVGLTMGGALLRHHVLENYRIYLYVTAGIFFAAAAGVALAYNPPPRELQVTLTTGKKLRRLNWVSYLLFTPGLRYPGREIHIHGPTATSSRPSSLVWFSSWLSVFTSGDSRRPVSWTTVSSIA
jgi:MFS family permease